MNIVQEYSTTSQPSECNDKVTNPSQVLKDICDELLIRAKKGDNTAFEILKKVFASKLEELV